MGFPFENGSWTDVSGAIFMGAGGSAPGIYAVIGIAVCIIALIAGQKSESSKYSDHK
jgi:hypothetical protein